MPRPIETATDSELAQATGIDRRQIPALLNAAGIAPLSETVRNGGTHRAWPKVKALRVLRKSYAVSISGSRDAESDIRAKILEIKRGLRDGSLVRVSAVETHINKLSTALKQFYDSFSGRHAADIATAYLQHTTDDDARRNALNASFASTFDKFATQLKEPASWHQK